MDGVSHTSGGALVPGAPMLTTPIAMTSPTVSTLPIAMATGGAAMNKPATLPIPMAVGSPMVGKAPDSSLKMSSSAPAGSGIPQVAPPIITRTAVSSDKVLDKRRLQELVKEVDPLEQLEDEVEEMLLQIADDFIDNVVTAGCQLARHRKSNTVEVKDIQLHLERNWNMWIPGFGSEELRPYKKAATTEAHKQRLALIKKTLKKF